MQGLFVLFPTFLFAIFAAAVVWYVSNKACLRDNATCQTLSKSLDTNKQQES
jgi:hypothetical protein